MNPAYLQQPHHALVAQPATSGFVTGFVASGCISAFRDTPAPASPAQVKRVLRHALQGGAALAAGRQAAVALQQGDYGRGLVAVAAGAAGVLLFERLLRDSAPNRLEASDGQEA